MVKPTPLLIKNEVILQKIVKMKLTITKLIRKKSTYLADAILFVRPPEKEKKKRKKKALTRGQSTENVHIKAQRHIQSGA